MHLIDEIKECEDLWERDMYEDWVVEEFLVKELYHLDTREYLLTDLLSSKSIDLLIKRGEAQLNCKKRGGIISQIRDGEKMDLSYLAPLYEELFERWENAGWIELEGGSEESEEELNIVLL